MSIHIRRILCPLDFSESSEHALLYAREFARAHDAELLLLHVVELPVTYLAADVALGGMTAVQYDNDQVDKTAAIAGAIVLVIADLLARVVLAPVELPVGIVTALAGGPFFVWLLVRGERAR